METASHGGFRLSFQGPGDPSAPLPVPVTLVSKEAAALDQNLPGVGQEMKRVRGQGISGGVQHRRVSSLAPQVESEMTGISQMSYLLCRISFRVLDDPV